MSSSAEVGDVRRSVYAIDPYISASTSESSSRGKPASEVGDAAKNHPVECLSVLAFKFFPFMLDNRRHRHEYLVACQTTRRVDYADVREIQIERSVAFDPAGRRRLLEQQQSVVAESNADGDLLHANPAADFQPC